MKTLIQFTLSELIIIVVTYDLIGIEINYIVLSIKLQNSMKEQSNDNRLGGGVMQQVSGHQNSMNMVMDNMGMCMTMMMPNNQQQLTSVPMDPSGSSVQSIQVVAGSSTQITHDQIIQNQTNAPTQQQQQEEEEESSEDDENSDDECDGDEGVYFCTYLL